MLARFQGQEGKARLIAAIAEQKLVHGNEAIASEIVAVCELAEYAAGDNIIIQHRDDTDIHFILSGNVTVVINRRDIAHRKSGMHVGEMAIIDPVAMRSATVRVDSQVITAKISEPSFTVIADKHPKLWRRIAVELGNRLREREKFIKQPNETPFIFIASSGEYLPFANAIRDGIYASLAKVDVKVWTDGVFEASDTAIESLETVLQMADFGVAIFGAEDIVQSRGDVRAAPRDNVILELGWMMGACTRERTFIVQPLGLDIKIPSDLLGVTRLQFDDSLKDQALNAMMPTNEFLIRKINELGSK